jgi:hypothetical protein
MNQQVPVPGAARGMTAEQRAEFTDKMRERLADPSLVKPWEELRELQDANASLVRQLAERGVALSTADIARTKLQALVELLFDPQTVEGQQKIIALETRFETEMSVVLKSSAQQLTQQMLAAGVTIPPDQWAELAGQSGMAGLIRPRGGK